MAEVPEVGEAHAAVAEDARDLARVELRCGGGERPVADEEQHDQPARHRQRRDEQDVRAPVGAAHGVDQIRRGLPQRERPDQDAQRSPTPAPEPRRHYFHPRRIDSGEKKTDEEAQSDAHAETLREESEAGVHDCARDCRSREEVARAYYVGQVEERREKRARDEAELHGERQPTRRGFRKMPLRAERGRDG